jgi:hypothetical protein
MQFRKSFLIALVALGLATSASAQAVKPISQLPSATVPLGTAAVPVLQGGATKQAPAAALGIPIAGSVAPTPLARYQLWWNTATNPPTWEIYDGAQWVPLGSLDLTSHVFTSINQLAPTVAIPQPSGTAQASSDINALGASGVGNITVPSTTGWPATGYLRTADNGEYLAYVRGSATTLAVTGRGQCGSGAAAIAHPNATSVIWMAILACPPSGSTPPLIAVDGIGTQYINGVKLTQYAVATVALFRSTNLSAYTRVATAGWATAGDRLGGTYVKSTNVCTDDGGACLHDGSGASWLRADIKTTPVSWLWYGYVAGADQATGCDGGACSTKASAAAAAYGNNHITTGGAPAVTSINITLDEGQDFTCEVVQVRVGLTTYAGRPGSLKFTHGASFVGGNSKNAQEWHNCLVVTDGSGGQPINLTPATTNDLETNILNWTTNSDVAFKCEGESGGDKVKVHDMTFAGFDAAAYNYKCSAFEFYNNLYDTNVGLLQGPTKSPAIVYNNNFFNLLGNVISTANRNLVFTVQNIVSGTGGVCRYTVSSTASMVENYPIVITPDSNVSDTNMGPRSCYGEYPLHIVDSTHFEAQGSVFATGTFYTTDGTTNWQAKSSIVWLKAPSTTHEGQGIIAGQTMTGARTGTILYVSDYVQPTATGGSGFMFVILNNESASGGSGVVNIVNNGAYVYVGTPCNDTSPDTACASLLTSTRYHAGNSYPGEVTGHRAACIWVGGPGDTSTGGINAHDNFCYGVRDEYALAGAGPAYFSASQSDGDKPSTDPLQRALYVGNGVPPLKLNGVSHNGNKIIDTLTLDGIALDPRKAGIQKGDFLTGPGIANDGSSCSGSKVTDLDATSITVTTNSTGGSGQIVDQGSDSANCGTSYRNGTSNLHFTGPALSGGGGIVFDSTSANDNVVDDVTINPQGLGTVAVAVYRGRVSFKVKTTQPAAFAIGKDALQVKIIGSGAETANTGPIYADGLNASRDIEAVGNHFLGGGNVGNQETFGVYNNCTPPADFAAPVRVCSGSVSVGPAPTGGALGDGTVNTSGGVFKNSTEYLAPSNVGTGLQFNGGSVSTIQCCNAETTLAGGATASMVNTDCGTFYYSSGLSLSTIVAPSSPPLNCQVKLNISQFAGTYLDFNGHYGKWNGVGDHQITTFLFQASKLYATVWVGWDGTQWNLIHCDALACENSLPTNMALAANGQVRLVWTPGTSTFDLTPYGGPGWLVANGYDHRILSAGLKLAQANLPSSNNLVYLYMKDCGHTDVTNIANNGSGKVRLTVAAACGAAGDQVQLNTYSIPLAATPAAMGPQTGTVIDSTHIDIPSVSYVAGSSIAGGTRILKLYASTTGHVPSSDGTGTVEVENGGLSGSLVGLAYIAGSLAVNDSATKRDVASFYNRRLKTCKNAFTADRSTTTTANFVELNSEIECEFVTWGDEDVRWTIAGMMSTNIGTDGGAVSAGFDGTTAESEVQSGFMNVNTTKLPVGLPGLKTGLSEGKHYGTFLGKALTGGTFTVSGTTTPGTLDIGVMQ